MIAEIYLSADSFRPFAVGIVPLYAYGEPSGNYVALPLYDLATNLNYMCSMSRGEVKRAKEAQSIATRIVLGQSIALENAHPRYFLYPDGAVATPLITPIDVSNERRKSRILDEFERANSICFVGDSITEGTMNGGYGWYEPIMANYPEKNVSRFAKGSMTSKYFATQSDSIAKIGAELYVLSFGCNDIRYRDPQLCAMTDTEYIEQIRILVEAIRKANPKSRMICVAPWISASHDKNCKCSLVEKEKLYHAYTKALAAYCQNEGIVFVDPNPIVEGILRKAEGMGVMVDYIHPGAAIGVHLYSKACMESN